MIPSFSFVSSILVRPCKCLKNGIGMFDIMLVANKGNSKVDFKYFGRVFGDNFIYLFVCFISEKYAQLENCKGEVSPTSQEGVSDNCSNRMNFLQFYNFSIKN